MPVDASAGQRQEQPAGSDFAGIEFDGPGDVNLRGVFGGDVGEFAADDGGNLRHGEVDHARASSAAASSTRSSKGCVCPLRVWPVSWPLPAISTTSPVLAQ